MLRGAETSIARAAAPACRYWSKEFAIAVDPPFLALLPRRLA